MLSIPHRLRAFLNSMPRSSRANTAAVREDVPEPTLPRPDHHARVRREGSHSLAKDFTRQLSLKEMELSEDYTCVIIHGPNPKTTHIYDDCIVESSCVDNDDLIFEEKMKDSGSDTNLSSPPLPNFMSFCHTCKDVLGQDRDIYIFFFFLSVETFISTGARKRFVAKNVVARGYFRRNEESGAG
ncbi:hypothetical protein ACS0TY_011287 [Phlomoides rotata]